MPGALKSREEIRQSFEDEILKTRRDTLVAAGFVVLVTLLVLGAAVYFGVMLARRGDAADPAAVFRVRGIVIAANVLIGYVLLFTLVGNTRMLQHQRGWLAAGAAVLGGLVLLSLGTRLWWSHPPLFWCVFVAGSIAALGLVGHAYEARDDYYLGWMGGRMDDPFTYRDDIDRGHLAAGFAVAVPRLVVGAFGDLFGSFWLWGGLAAREIEAAADILHALGSLDRPKAESRLRALSRPRGALLARWLSHLKLVQRGPDGLGLTDAGERLLGIGAWY